MSTKKLSIFEYDDYRRFLRDFYNESKNAKSSFSFRYFSRIAGFQSPNFLKRVMEGDRNLSVSGIEKFAAALKLSKDEAAFFRSLVFFNQAKTSEEKRTYAEQLLKSQAYKKIHPLHESQFNYYAHWYFIPIREMIGVKGFKEDPAWIAKKLNPTITAAEAKKALEELLKLGLIVRNEQGKLEQTHQHLATGDLVTSASLAQYHREMAKKAAESIDRTPREGREISSVTLGVSAGTLKKMKEMLKKFQVELVQTMEQDQNPDKIYQVNFHIFPLTEILNEGTDK